MGTELAPVTRRLELTKAGERLLVPSSYSSGMSLDSRAHHTFERTGEIKEKLDEEVPDWTDPNVIHALLTNADLFWVDIKDDIRFHGGVAVVKNVCFSDTLDNPIGYEEDRTARVNEKEMKNLKCEIAPGITSSSLLKRYDAYGKKWSRRRYTLKDNETFSFVQWMNAKAAKLKELADVADQCKSLEESYKVLRNDVSQMKVLLQSHTAMAQASLAIAESHKEIVKEQSKTNAAIAEEMAKLRSDLRRET